MVIKTLLQAALFAWVQVLPAGAETPPGVVVQVDQAIPKAGARIGAGSRITLRFPQDPSAHSGVFLGQLVKSDGSLDQVMVLDEDRNRVFFIDRSRMDLPRGPLQHILRPYPQVDGTCTGYAMQHLMAQLSVTGVAGNPALKNTFSTEQGRTQFLVRAVNDYYIATQHRNSIAGILKGYASEFGLRCERKVFPDGVRALRYLREKTDRGIPVLMAYDIGPNMVNGDFTLQNLSGPKRLLDQRLWVPRQIGERLGGGHSILAVSTFESRGKDEVLVLDSDWAEPRVWNPGIALADRTRMQDVEFHSCE